MATTRTLGTLRRTAIDLLKKAMPFRVRFAVRSLRAGMRPRDVAAMMWGEEEAYRRTAARLGERMKAERTLDDIVETAFRFEGEGQYRTIKPQQNPDEIKALLVEVARHEPKTILEIGTGRGGTLYMVCRFLTSATRVITVDLPPDARSQWNNVRLWRTFSEQAELVFLEGDSHGRAIRDEVARLVGPRGADFIFIDGDHSYEGVRSDYEGYLPLLAKGGVFAMHDVNLHESGVPRFWSEIAGETNGRAIISPEPPSPGIGYFVG